jgi:DNA-binding LacI/PurR family transcriptional regulator
VHLSYFDLGHMAAATLFRLLDGEEVPTVQLMPVDLVVRDSTAAVHAQAIAG